MDLSLPKLRRDELSLPPSVQPLALTSLVFSFCQTRSEDWLTGHTTEIKTRQLFSLPEARAPARLSPIKELDRQKARDLGL